MEVTNEILYVAELCFSLHSGGYGCESIRIILVNGLFDATDFTTYDAGSSLQGSLFVNGTLFSADFLLDNLVRLANFLFKSTLISPNVALNSHSRLRFCRT